MIANVQYNDFRGTIAADGRDPENSVILQKYLESKGVDTCRYTAVGFDFFGGEGRYCFFSVICKDVENPAVLTKISCGERQTYEEFFSLFKRLNIVGYSKYHTDAEDMEVKPETIYFVDKEA